MNYGVLFHNMSKRPRMAQPSDFRMNKRQRTAMYQRPQSVQQIVRKEVARQGDLKYTDVSQQNQSVTSSGTVLSTTANLVRGDTGLNGFDGNTITPRGLTVKYAFNTNQSHNQVRVLCFQWFDSAVPTLSGIVQTNATGLATLAPILVTNKDYIKVLYDQSYIIAPTAGVPDTTVLTSIYGQGTCNGKFYIPGSRMKKIRFNSNTNTVQDGHIYILLVSDDSAPTYPAVNLYSRLSFYD